MCIFVFINFVFTTSNDEEQHKREKLFLKSNCVIPLLTFSIAIIPTQDLVLVESKKRNIQPSSQDQKMNCIKLLQLIFSGQLNFLTLQKKFIVTQRTLSIKKFFGNLLLLYKRISGSKLKGNIIFLQKKRVKQFLFEK